MGRGEGRHFCALLNTFSLLPCKLMQIAPGLMCVKGKKAQVALSYHLSSLPSVNSGKRYVELSTQHA